MVLIAARRQFCSTCSISTASVYGRAKASAVRSVTSRNTNHVKSFSVISGTSMVERNCEQVQPTEQVVGDRLTLLTADIETGKSIDNEPSLLGGINGGKNEEEFVGADSADSSTLSLRAIFTKLQAQYGLQPWLFTPDVDYKQLSKQAKEIQTSGSDTITYHQMTEYISQLTEILESVETDRSTDSSEKLYAWVYGSWKEISIQSEFKSPESLERYLKYLCAKRKMSGTFTDASKAPSRFGLDCLVYELMRINNRATQFKRSTEAYNIAMKYFARKNNFRAAVELFKQMPLDGAKYNATSFNILLINSRMRQKKIPFSNLQYDILRLKEMINLNVKPNASTWNIVLANIPTAVGKLIFLEKLQQHGIGLSDRALSCIVQDIISVCGPIAVMDIAKERNSTSVTNTVASSLISIGRNDLAWKMISKSKTVSTATVNTFLSRYVDSNQLDLMLGFLHALGKRALLDAKSFHYLFAAVAKQPVHVNKFNVAQMVFQYLRPATIFKRTTSLSAFVDLEQRYTEQLGIFQSKSEIDPETLWEMSKVFKWDDNGPPSIESAFYKDVAVALGASNVPRLTPELENEIKAWVREERKKQRQLDVEEETRRKEALMEDPSAELKRLLRHQNVHA